MVFESIVADGGVIEQCCEKIRRSVKNVKQFCCCFVCFIFVFILVCISKTLEAG